MLWFNLTGDCKCQDEVGLISVLHLLVSLRLATISNMLYLLKQTLCSLTTLTMSRLHSIDDGIINECAAVGGMRIGSGNQSTRRKPAQVPLYRPQISHDLT
jgi:hypothetical protein